MQPVRPLPATGSVFFDARGGDRALRVSWHHESGMVVLSLWRDNVCTGSFRLAVREVPELIETLLPLVEERAQRASRNQVPAG